MRSPIQSYLEELHVRFGEERSGSVASYIPELGLADPEWFAICVATTDGRVYEVGDARRRFTIQSMSKPFTYGLALEDRGRDAVRAKVGVEPSGDAFNSISLAPVTGRPLNPMINAGAITATSLVAGDDLEERFRRILATHSRHAGRALGVEEGVFESEQRTGHRNRAIGHMLRTFNILSDNPDRTLELYFRQCSIAVDARDVSVMAATLANGGRNPVTGERALAEKYVERVLSVMTTCGMYDGSGEWVDAVGLPAKSGVSGAIFAVLPGQLGVCVFSPRLDPQGNSVRGVAVCRALAEDLYLHSLRVARSARSTIRAIYDVGAVPSRRRRPAGQVAALATVGTRAVVYELQGDLLFAGVERVVRSIVERAAELDVVVLDLRSVGRLERPSAAMLLRLRDELQADGKELAFVAGRELAGLDAEARVFADLDVGREWCEERLLAALGFQDTRSADIAVAQHGFTSGLDEAAVAELAALMTVRRFAPGETIVATGDAAEEIFLVLAGEVGVYLPLADGGRRRLATLPAGATFGELAGLVQATRTADIVAERDASLMVLDADTFDRLGDTNPRLKARLLQNLLAIAHDTVTRMSRELAALAREA